MTYDVTIEATVRKTIRIEDAQCEDEAIQFAHGRFKVAKTDEPEKYDEQTIDIQKV